MTLTVGVPCATAPTSHAPMRHTAVTARPGWPSARLEPQTLKMLRNGPFLPPLYVPSEADMHTEATKSNGNEVKRKGQTEKTAPSNSFQTHQDPRPALAIWDPVLHKIGHQPRVLFLWV